MDWLLATNNEIADVQIEKWKREGFRQVALVFDRPDGAYAFVSVQNKDDFRSQSEADDSLARWFSAFWKVCDGKVENISQDVEENKKIIGEWRRLNKQ